MAGLVPYEVLPPCVEDRCAHKALVGHDRCLNHLTSEDLQTALKGLKPGGSLDFRGNPVNEQLVARVRKAMTNREGSFLLGAVLFDGATFSGSPTFDGAAFSEDASFRGATFSGDALFDNATFSWAALFEEATFSGAARFAGVDGRR